MIRNPQPLWAYMRGIARNCGFDILSIGGTSNHIHILLALPPRRNLVETIRDLKANSSRFMKNEVQGFAWQDGYSALSVSPSQIQAVKRYIAGQPEHHRKRTFDDEYLVLLDKAGVKYDRAFVLG